MEEKKVKLKNFSLPLKILFIMAFVALTIYLMGVFVVFMDMLTQGY